MKIDFLFLLNLGFGDLYTIAEQIPDIFAQPAVLISLLSLLLFIYSTFKPKKSDVNIGYQYEAHGAVIRQQNRIDIDLFLQVENKGDLAGKIEFFSIGGDIQFKSSDESTTVSSSEFGKKEQDITYHSLDGSTLIPGDASSVTARFKFSEDDRFSELLSQYEELEISWSARVTEAEREYPIDGIATLNISTGGARFPPPTSIDSKDN